MIRMTVGLATVEELADAGGEERAVGLADAGVDDSVFAAAEAHSYGLSARDQRSLLEPPG